MGHPQSMQPVAVILSVAKDLHGKEESRYPDSSLRSE